MTERTPPTAAGIIAEGLLAAYKIAVPTTIFTVDDFMVEAGAVIAALRTAGLLPSDTLKAANGRLRSALAHIGADMHQTSTRPCTTCSYVTRMRGADFGCVEFAKEQQAKHFGGASVKHDLAVHGETE